MLVRELEKIKLPSCEGFNQFAIWPDSLSVSSQLFQLIWICKWDFQTKSSYVLLDYKSIESPDLSGIFVELPYFPDCRYVAYKAEKGGQVGPNFNYMDESDIVYTLGTKC